ncbi:MAG: LamG-like jellyroll fold domain-containing protein [Planctomycetota bacterium]
MMRIDRIRMDVGNQVRVALLGMVLFGLCGECPSAEPDDRSSDVSLDLARGLVGHWTFDEGAGTIARDTSGRDNHGTVMGGAKWNKGIIRGALEFDGTDDFVSIPHESQFDITGSITVSAWIRVESFTKSWQAIVTKGDRAWRLHRASKRKSVGFACSDLSQKQTGDLLGNKVIADGHWHHVAGVLDGTGISIYVDGALDARATSSPNISVNDYAVLIGANAQVQDRRFHGLIDDVRIYDRALSVDEVRSLVKSAGVEPSPTSEPITVTLPSLPGKFQKIFDGKTLEGWNALDMSYWSVRDGAITGESTDKHPCKLNQFLVWQGGDVADFEVKLKFRAKGNGCNTGVQFRSKMRDDGLAVGYQADIFQSGGYLGGVCDELHNRDGPELLSANGSRTVISKGGKRTRTPIDTMAKFKPWDQWNDYHIIADGHKMILRINGVTASELIDKEEGHFDLQGILGLQLRAGKPMTVQFKDIYLKRGK